MSWTAAIKPNYGHRRVAAVTWRGRPSVLNLRNFIGWALAPAFSTTAVAVAGVPGGWSRATWNLGVYAARAVATNAAAVVSVRCLPARNHPMPPMRLAIGPQVPAILAAGRGATRIVYRLLLLFQSPENISQSFDIDTDESVRSRPERLGGGRMGKIGESLAAELCWFS